MATSMKGDSVGEVAISEVRGGLPIDYNPQKSLIKRAAYKELAERAARVKDATALHDALVGKLGEERNFVLWWDEQEKHPGEPGPGRPRKTP